LAEAGHRVFFFAPVGPMDERLAVSGVETVTLSQPDLLSDASAISAAKRGIWNAAAAKKLAEILRPLGPNRAVVCQHGWSKAMSPACQRAIANSGLATVYHMHEYFAACPNDAFFDYQDMRNCQLAPMSFKCITKHCDARSYTHKAFRVARHLALNGPG
jgi:hypothetical protein